MVVSVSDLTWVSTTAPFTGLAMVPVMASSLKVTVDHPWSMESTNTGRLLIVMNESGCRHRKPWGQHLFSFFGCGTSNRISCGDGGYLEEICGVKGGSRGGMRRRRTRGKK